MVHRTIIHFKLFLILKRLALLTAFWLEKLFDMISMKRIYAYTYAYQVTHLCCTSTWLCILNNTFNCHWVFGLKSFITLTCMELKSKAPSEEEGHLNHCQELTAHCTQLPLTIFHHWRLLHCRLSPYSLFSSVHVWHVENSSSEQSLASACECGLSGSQTPMLFYTTKCFALEAVFLSSAELFMEHNPM